MERSKNECNKCERKISLSNFSKHYKLCGGKRKDLIEDYKTKEGYKCPECGKVCKKYGIKNHIWRNHTEKGKQFIVNGIKEKRKIGIEAWNKGLTKETSEGVKRNSDALKGRVGTFKGKHHSEEAKRKISESMSKNNNGGKCKWFEVETTNGEKIKVQGTWEVRFANILNKIDESWFKPTLCHKQHSFKWIDSNDKKHTYTPDFFSPKLNKYFEVKGYWWGNDKEKMELVLLQNKNIKIEIIMGKDLESYEKLYATIT